MSSKDTTESEYSFSVVMGRLKTAVAVKADNELAKLLGMSSGDYANRKSRNAIPFERLAALAYSRNVSIDWLLTGEGSPVRDEPPTGVNDQAAPYQGNNHRARKMLEVWERLDEEGRRDVQAVLEKIERMQTIERELAELKAWARSIKSG